MERKEIVIPPTQNNKYIFLAAFFVVVAYLLVNFFIIVPSFSKLLFENIEGEANKMATHLSSMVVSENNSLYKQEELASMAIIGKLISEFHIEELKIFSEYRETIYSTDPEEIGQKNNDAYFHNIVAKGDKHTTLAPRVLEGQKARSNILHTYVPIMSKGKFVGAFEINFDITDKLQRLDNAVLTSSLVPLFLMFIFLLAVIYLLKTGRTAMLPEKVKLAARYRSPFFLLFVISASIFAAEAFVMWMLSVWQPSSVLTEALFDSSALVMIVSPVLYYAVVMPLMSHITMRTQIEGQLQKAHDELEQRVQERTAELKTANVDLKREISTRLEYQEQIQLSDSVLENTIEGIMITGADGIIQRVNSSFSMITGYSSEEAIGKPPKILRSGHHKADFYKEMWGEIKKEGKWKGEIWNRRKNGEGYPERLSIVAIKGSDGETSHYVGVFHDISEIKDAEKKLSHQAFHDALTGLPNRELFTDRLETALSHAQRHHAHVGLLFLDLDNFKNINDSLGHNLGDIYLQEVAKRLKDKCRQEDTVSRFGGDEFTVILPNVNDAEDVVALTKRIIESFAEPIRVNEHNLFVSASIGITLYPEDGDNVEELVKNADMAMYSAKASGKNKLHLFAPEMNVRVNRRMHVENDLRNAVEEQEFVVYYQPKVNLVSGAIVGAEALVRWQRQDGTIVSPGEFIPIAEDTGLIVPIGEFVLESACMQARKWHDAGYPIGVAVNLSMRQFREKNLVEMVKKTLQKSGLAATSLELEITESLLMESEEASLKTLQQLKKEGIKFAIDDFGTGYSSMSYLKKMPIDSLKIDRAFVKDLPDDNDDIAICTAIISLAESLGLTTVAEGAETIEQYTLLRKLGCTEVQGFYFSPPVVPDTMTTFLEEGKKVDFNRP